MRLVWIGCLSVVSGPCLQSTAQSILAVEWLQTAGGSGFDYGQRAAVGPNGDFFVTGGINATYPRDFVGDPTFGTVTLTERGLGDVFLARYAPDGQVVSAQLEGGTDHEMAYALDVDDAGSVYIAGHFLVQTTIGSTILGTAANGGGGFVAKYTPSGELDWARQIGSSNDLATDVSVDTEGNVYVAGSFEGSFTQGEKTIRSRGWSDLLLLKYDAGGSLQWSTQIGGPDWDYLFARVTTDLEGNVVIVGAFRGTARFGEASFLTSAGEFDLFVAKYTSSGILLWAKKSGGIGDDLALSCVAGEDGAIYVTGSIYGHAYVAKYAPDGTLQWEKVDTSFGTSSATAAALDTSGDLYVVGAFSRSLNLGKSLSASGRQDLFVSRFSPAGTTLWLEGIGGVDADVAGYGIGVDQNGSVFMSGTLNGRLSVGSATFDTGKQSDILFLKFSDAAIVSVDEDLVMPSQFALEQNYPNPFNPATAIRFSLEEASHVSLTVHNLLGNEVAVLVDGPMGSGAHEIRWDAGRLASGLYLYRLTAGSFSETRQMALLK